MRFVDMICAGVRYCSNWVIFKEFSSETYQKLSFQINIQRNWMCMSWIYLILNVCARDGFHFVRLILEMSSVWKMRQINRHEKKLNDKLVRSWIWENEHKILMESINTWINIFNTLHRGIKIFLAFSFLCQITLVNVHHIFPCCL